MLFGGVPLAQLAFPNNTDLEISAVKIIKYASSGGFTKF